ncbi:hypothetical protein [Pseudomonas spirodelae]|uniref:Uncharacterized protein n=1 Tax=Pseudomonas spirodelae TaxID=3101751 RepID=A0ABU5PB60_9PSED|nr:hypothetical protein [Pseudomonas sp. T5W1]MEA1606892.1 hypothetical protein [Pseudomonas sp. T5W1]
MQTRTHENPGVTCVIGVIKSLKASNGGAFSHITQLHKAAYTNAKQHQLCNEKPLFRLTPPPFVPAGRSDVSVARRTPAQAGARLARVNWGMGQ